MYYIGYDIGSSSIKAALVEIDTAKPVDLLSEPEHEMGMISLQNGWAEQDPDQWWKYICTATQKLISKYDIVPEDIKGIGISYQMHGLVVVDKGGDLLRNSIIWCDGRAVDIGNQAHEDLGEQRCAEQLLNSPANFTASKLKWVKENEPDVYDRIHKIMLPGDYIAYKFSGEIQTTVSGLSEGIFWDFKEKELAYWLLDYYNLDKSYLPEIIPTFSIQAEVSENGSDESGLKKGTPILYRAGDQPNNALSLNIFDPGEVAATGGTSGVFYAVTDNLSVKESARVNNFAHVNYRQDQVRIGKLLCINGAGILYRWLLNNLGVKSYKEMNALAEEIPIGSDGLRILPFGNGPERMLKNRDLGVSISQLNLNRHDKSHLCRASLEGIAFAFAYGMEILKSDGVRPKIIRAGNDNLFKSNIFSQTIADLINQEIEIYATSGAIGAARACSIYHNGLEEYRRQVKAGDFEKKYSPSAKREMYQEAYLDWKKELEKTLKTN